MRKRVLIADDHAIWRRGLRDVLEPTFDVSEAGDGGEAVEKTLASRPDVVMMDIGLPGMDGITATRKIKEHSPDTAVLIVSASDQDQEIYESIEAGASGYIVKDDSPETMREAVQSAADGKAYLPPLIAKRVLRGGARSMSSHKDASGKAATPLSSREIEVLRLIAMGRNHKEIANALSISERTVDKHVGSIYNKLGIYDRTQAILYAIKQRLIHL